MLERAFLKRVFLGFGGRNFLAAAMGVGAVVCFAGRVGMASPSYTITEVGLTGPNYTYNGSGGFYQSSGGSVDALGGVSGSSARYSSTGSSLGQDSWFYNGITTEQIGLTGGGYSSTVAGGTFEKSIPLQMNGAGDVIGQSDYVTGTSTTGAFDAWIFNGTSTQKLGLSGSQYTGAQDEPSAINSAGEVTGYDSVNSNFADTWFYNGSSVQQIGLTGSVYTVSSGGTKYEVSFPTALNDAGEVVGESQRFGSTGSNLGSDAWIFNGSVTQQIGLTGGVYTTTGNFEYGAVAAIAANGDVLGYSNRYSTAGGTLGQVFWLYNGSTTVEMGLTGTNYSYQSSGQTYQQNVGLAINSSGEAIGFSYRYDSSGDQLGQDAWIYNGATTQQIGLTGTGYSGTTSNGTVQSSKPVAINANGDVIGTSNRYTSSGQNVGADSWYFNGSTLQQIGVTQAQDPATGTINTIAGALERVSAPTALNAAGDVIGISSRWNSAGQSNGNDGWYFDPNLDETFLLQFSINSSTDYSNTHPEILTATGGVLGEYELFSGSTDEGMEAFYWSEGNGLSNLGVLVNGGLSAAGWENLANVSSSSGALPDGSPLYITGEGLLTGEGGGQSAFLMSQVVPEPGMGAVLVAGLGVGMMMRRRRGALLR